MKREAKKHPQALADLYRQGRYYVEEGSPETAARFLAAAEPRLRAAHHDAGDGSPQKIPDPAPG